MGPTSQQHADVPQTKHRHGEAFCLMWYACKSCGHRERIWNSRDGVTPFGMGCPSCGWFGLMHVDWRSDERAPNHNLHRAQRFWRDGTKLEAIASIERRFAAFAIVVGTPPEDIKAQMLADLDKPSDERSEFRDGWPQIDVHPDQQEPA